MRHPAIPRAWSPAPIPTRRGGPARPRLPTGRIAPLLLLLAWLAPLHPAAAHELRPLIATRSMEQDTARLVLSLNLEAAIAGIGPEHSNTADSPAAPLYDRLRALPPEALAAEFQDFAPRLLDAVDLRFGGRRAPLALAAADIPPVGDLALPRITELTLTAPRPAGGQAMHWRLAPVLGDSVIRLAAPGTAGILRATYVTAGATAGPLTLEGAVPQPWPEVFTQYLRLGFVHIVPKGLDHILFVVGLFLLSARLSPLLWQVSAFTLAHTVTLGLGAAGVVRLSPAIVEPLIALSIVWVAVENLLTDRLHPWRPVVVFGFGLLHGLGFAGVLAEIGLPERFLTGLIAFNLGVELGQLTVVAACLALVGWARNRPAYRRAVVLPGSLSIALVAAWWVVERTVLT